MQKNRQQQHILQFIFLSTKGNRFKNIQTQLKTKLAEEKCVLLFAGICKKELYILA